MADRIDEYAIPFAAWELRLFLDTHPDNAAALEAYRGYCAQAAEHGIRCAYPCMTDTENGWTWISDPWPWEPEANEARPTEFCEGEELPASSRSAAFLPSARNTEALPSSAHSCGCNPMPESVPGRSGETHASSRSCGCRPVNPPCGCGCDQPVPVRVTPVPSGNYRTPRSAFGRM